MKYFTVPRIKLKSKYCRTLFNFVKIDNFLFSRVCSIAKFIQNEIRVGTIYFKNNVFSISFSFCLKKFFHIKIIQTYMKNL